MRHLKKLWVVGIVGLGLLIIQKGFQRFYPAVSTSVSSVISSRPEESAQAPVSSSVEYPRIAGGRPPCSNDNPVTVENVEQYNWSYCDFDLRPFWKTLGVPAGRFERSPSLFQVSSSFGDFDGDSVDERILNVQQNGVCRIVVLKRPQEGKWTSIGLLDIPTFHLFPEARVVTNGRGRWLAVSHHTESAWGTGIFQEDEKWYAFDQGRLREVLSFPETGKLAGPLQFAWMTDASPRASDGSMDVIDIDYAVTIGTSLGDGIGGDFHHTVSYSKSPSSLKFSFDPELSEMKKAEFQSLYNLADLTWQHWAKLVRLAAKHDSSFNDMFDRVLTACRKADDRFWNCDEIAEELR